MQKLFASALLAAAAMADVSRYDAKTRSFTVVVDGADRFRYTFGLGGAVDGIYDL
jgi:hypothetical protein